VVNLLVLPGILASAIVGAVVVPWYEVYGSWPRQDFELDGLGYQAMGLGIGVGVWLIAWTVTFLGPRAVWVVILALCLLAPALVVNIKTFRAARDQVCEIRSSNGHDERLHDVPWPLALDCGYGPWVTTCEVPGCLRTAALAPRRRATTTRR
jgi:hypothetical protein